MNSFKTNPAVRATLRAIAVGVVVYLVGVFHAGETAFNGKTFLWGLIGAVVYAAAGLLTPLEPKVGIKTDVQG